MFLIFILKILLLIAYLFNFYKQIKKIDSIYTFFSIHVFLLLFASILDINNLIDQETVFYFDDYLFYSSILFFSFFNLIIWLLFRKNLEKKLRKYLINLKFSEKVLTSIFIFSIVLMILKFVTYDYGFGFEKNNSSFLNSFQIFWYLCYTSLIISLLNKKYFYSIVLIISLLIEFFLSSSKGIILNIIFILLVVDYIKSKSLKKYFKPYIFLPILIIVFSSFIYSLIYRYQIDTFNSTVDSDIIIEGLKESNIDEDQLSIVFDYFINRNEVYTNYKYQFYNNDNNKILPYNIITHISMFNFLPTPIYKFIFGDKKTYFSYFSSKHLLDNDDGSSASVGRIGESFYNWNIFFILDQILFCLILFFLFELIIGFKLFHTFVLTVLLIIVRDDAIFENSFIMVWSIIIETTFLKIFRT